jgi:hypothetical protein
MKCKECGTIPNLAWWNCVKTTTKLSQHSWPPHLCGPMNSLPQSVYLTTQLHDISEQALFLCSTRIMALKCNFGRIPASLHASPYVTLQHIVLYGISFFHGHRERVISFPVAYFCRCSALNTNHGTEYRIALVVLVCVWSHLYLQHHTNGHAGICFVAEFVFELQHHTTEMYGRV